MNRIDLDGRVAVVTGGAGGIGLATAERMIASGATVVLWDQGRAALDHALRGNPALTGHEVDVTDETSIGRATAEVVERHGRIDILVNAAGITAPKALIAETRLESWRRIVDINLTGTFLACRAVVEPMLERDYGRIVNLGSISGKEGNPYSAAYSASKAAVHSFTKSLAKELARTGIRVNCVTPGLIQTDITGDKLTAEMRQEIVRGIPLGRLGTAQDVVGIYLFLASDLSAYVTGAVIDVNGGMLIHG